MQDSVISRLTKCFVTSDEQLMWRVQATGDGNAFARLVERWHEPIHRLCTRLTGDAHRAEDLAQEAFLRLFSHRRDYQAKARFSTFLWRIAVNLCHDERRRRGRRRETSLEDRDENEVSFLEVLSSEDPLPDAAAEFQERVESVRQALLQLSEHYRVVVVLRHYEDLKFHEIAEVLGLPVGTVKSRMAEALSQLHHLMRSVLADANAPQDIHRIYRSSKRL
jgi:RNA polymerase sigma-70 factor, ECF subfamily